LPPGHNADHCLDSMTIRFASFACLWPLFFSLFAIRLLIAIGMSEDPSLSRPIRPDHLESPHPSSAVISECACVLHNLNKKACPMATN